MAEPQEVKVTVSKEPGCIGILLWVLIIGGLIGLAWRYWYIAIPAAIVIFLVAAYFYNEREERREREGQ